MSKCVQSKYEKESKRKSIKFYKQKYGIIFEYDIKDISPIQWWKYLFYGTPNGVPLIYIPECLYTEQNIKQICIYVLEEILQLKTRESLLSLDTNIMRKYKIAFGNFEKVNISVLKLLTFCYPQYDIKQFELKDVPNNYWKEEIHRIEAIDWFLNKYEYQLEDVLNGNVNKDANNHGFFRTLAVLFYNKSIYDLWIWYFNNSNINIIDSDFLIKRKGYWNNIDNLIYEIKNYCENICIESIKTYIEINDNNKFYNWIQMYFNDKAIKNNKINNSKLISKRIYDILILAYPEVEINKLFFRWQITGCKEWTNKSFRIQSLKELVFYCLKLNDNIVDEIPKYICYSFLKNSNYIKFISANEQIYRSSNFYQWCCDAFPEYAQYWTEENFGKVYIANDGVKCNSIQERLIYEYFKDVLKLNIKAVGYKRKGKYIFKLPNEHIDNKYCPDFIIAQNNNIIIDKIIIVEYFGLKGYSAKYEWVKEYERKTIRKNEFYNSLEEYAYIDLYPSDLKNDFEILKIKINKFLFQKIA